MQNRPGRRTGRALAAALVGFLLPSACGLPDYEFEDSSSCRSAQDCPGGFECCSDVCVNPSRNPEHCGGCAVRCASGEQCVQGACTPACQAGAADCDEVADNGCETDTLRDREHCGTCDTACTNQNGTTRCSEGVCRPTCATGFADCDGNPANGCETDLDASLLHCGACGDACELENASEVCTAGVCRLDECTEGFADCDESEATGCEADLAGVANCGECGNECNANGGVARCERGTCGILCNPGREDCANGLADGCETNTSVSVLHCGECGNRCPEEPPTTPACYSGECGLSNCIDPRADCNGDEAEPDGDGCETNIANDVMHCGGCGIECFFDHAVASCEDKACVLVRCDAGYADCNDEPDDGCETELGTTANCTGCGDTCVAQNGTNACGLDGCEADCALGFADCSAPNDGCETSLDSVLNCGACDAVCAKDHAVSSCAEGTCTVDECDPGFADCDDEAVTNSGCETNLRTVANCGACGRACELPNAVTNCNSGTCTLVRCNAGFADCTAAPGCETQLGTATNCAACDNACQTQNAHVTRNVCVARASSFDCSATCASGWGSCDNDPDNGCETSLTSLTNCGACGAVCDLARTATHACPAEACEVVTCDPGWGNCNPSDADGCEQALTTDPDNCGACGTVCSSTNGTRGCTNGRCTITCSNAFGNCDNDVRDGCEQDLLNDPDNCGACGRTCTGGTPFCVNRACAARLAITVVASTTATTTQPGQDLRIPFGLTTARGNYRAVLVAVAGEGNAGAGRPSNVLFGETEMLLAREALTTGQIYAGIYYLTEDALPAPGSHDVLIRQAGGNNTFGFAANIIELRGVEKGAAAIEASTATDASNCTAASSTVNVTTPGALVYGLLGLEDRALPAMLAASGQIVTLQTTASGNPGAAAGYLPISTTAGNRLFQWNRAETSCQYRHVVLAIRPAVTP